MDTEIRKVNEVDENKCENILDFEEEVTNKDHTSEDMEKEDMAEIRH